MDQNHFTTDTLRKKGAHLTFEERVIIQTRLRDKQSYRSIAREIGCCVNTVRNEVKRGKVLCYIMGPLSRPRSKILRVAVSRIILSS
ncbi:helix-turn-helix domain-containing protein, partial [Megasphaera sp. CLA-AA-H81]